MDFIKFSFYFQPVVNYKKSHVKLQMNVLDMVQNCLVYNLNVVAEKMLDTTTNEFKNRFSGHPIDCALAEWVTGIEYFDFKHRQDKAAAFVLKRYDEDFEGTFFYFSYF